MRFTFGQYLPGDSLVHGLDPRIKVFLMGLGIAVAFLLDTPAGLAGLMLWCLVMTRLAHIPLRRLLRGLAPFLWLFLFTAVLHVFMTPGEPIPWLPHATEEGALQGIRVGCQLVFAIWISTIVTLATSPLDMVWALEWYLTPLKLVKVPVDEIALLVMLAIRFIPLLFEETDRVIKAQKARGIDLESGGICARVRSLVPILVPLLHGVFRRADDLAVALTLRGYTPGQPRSHMKVVRVTALDMGVLLGCTTILVGLGFL